MNRFLAIAIIWCAALLLLWPFTGLSGYAGNPFLGSRITNEILDSTDLDASCSDVLVDWTLATTRARIAYEQITGPAHRAAASRARDRYAEERCAAGAFLVAGRVAHDQAVEVRAAAGMGRAHLLNRLW